MYGAILGDIIGAPYEWHNTKSKDFPLLSKHPEFTDDTVMTIAVAAGFLSSIEQTMAGHTIIEDSDRKLLSELIIDHMKYYGRKYPDAGYGGHFRGWLKYGTEPYNSWGNGSAMRVSSAGWLFDDIGTVREMAGLQAAVTHNHPEGVKGAEAIASAIFLARTGNDKNCIKEYIVKEFGYDLNRTCDEIRPIYHFDVSCQGSVPEALIAFLEGNGFEDVIRTAISLGGDSDTIGAMAGSIAEAFYGIPEELQKNVRDILPEDMIAILDDYDEYLYEKIHGHPKNGIGFIEGEIPPKAVIYKEGEIVSTLDELFDEMPELSDQEMQEYEAKKAIELIDTVFKIDVSGIANFSHYYSIEVKDRQRDNLIIHNSKMLPYNRVETLSKKQLNGIKDAIQHGSVFEIGEIEFALVLDGFDDKIYFSIDGKSREIKTENLSYHLGSDKAPNATQLLSVIDQIYTILKDYGIDKRFGYL